MPLLPVNTYTAVCCGWLSQPAAALGTKLDVYSTTPNIDCATIGRFKICTRTACRLVWKRQVGLDAVDLLVL